MSGVAQVLALCGGVGGAKLALGLAHVLPPGELAIAVNTGDDFEHLGLAISPDLDTVLYTLAGLSHPVQGWGRGDETWHALDALRQLGGATWFALGDRDLALHLERTRRLRDGESLSAVTQSFAERLQIHARLWPMSNDRIRTLVRCDEGVLGFQDYFVRRRCEPRVISIEFDGAERARVLPEILEMLRAPGLRAVVICPSNPYLSVDPMLSMPALRDALERTAAPVVAVSPLIGGHAVKGPTAKMMREMALSPDNLAIASHYSGLLDGLVLDDGDAADAAGLSLPVLATPTRMTSLDDRVRLARATLQFADELAGSGMRRAS